jgi:hypothetical protein
MPAGKHPISARADDNPTGFKEVHALSFQFPDSAEGGILGLG